MAAMGSKQQGVHKAFLALKRPYDPTAVYIAMCKLVSLKEDSIERGLGKLFRDGDLKPPQDRVKKPTHRRSAGPPGEKFR